MSTTDTPAVAETAKPKAPPSLFETYEADANAEENGTPVEVLEGVGFYIRSAHSIPSRKWVQKRIRKNRQLYNANNGVLTPALQDVQDVDQLAEVIVLGWYGVRDKDGSELEYSVENARSLFKRLPQLRRDVMYAANEQETFRKSSLEATAKNSAQSSSTN